MSQENVELVRLAVEAYQRRDADALRPITHEEAELFTLTEGEMEGEPFRGHAGIDEWLEHELDPWEEFRVEPTPRRGIFEFRNGKIFRMRAYLDWDRAREAAGQSD